MKYNNILETIGNTPHVKINKIFAQDLKLEVSNNFEVWLKLERSNPGGSIKDRIALAMIEDALKNNLILKNTVVIEPTSGNTGIGLAIVCAQKGLKLILTMPESMSIERRKILVAFGAELILTPKEKGMKGAIDQAIEISKQHQSSFIPMQFENQSNIRIHRETTAIEILNDFPEGFDYLITGVGTGGHISGCAYILKEKFPNLKVFAVEPEKSPVISGGVHTPHRIQGIGAGFIPKNLQKELLDGVILVSEEEAFEYTRRVAKEEGIFVGISSGATLAAINKKIQELSTKEDLQLKRNQENTKIKILGFCYDTGERYLSIDNLFG